MYYANTLKQLRQAAAVSLYRQNIDKKRSLIECSVVMNSIRVAVNLMTPEGTPLAGPKGKMCAANTN
jgi:hypothetical protein